MERTLTKPRLLLVLLLGLGAAFGLCWGIPLGFERSAHSAAPGVTGPAPAEERRLTATNQENLLCGPKSMAGAAARLGVYIEPKALAAHCQVTPAGISMLALKQAASLFGLEARGEKMSWEQLAAQDRPVVLYLTPNHYVFVDPREPSPGGHSKQLRLYDFPNPARWITKEDLLKHWSGEVLIISRGETEARPALAFETLLEDFGAVYSKDAPAYQFRFRNTGRQVVKILDVKKSCGCTRAELSQSELKPGEEAHLTVSIDLKGRQGEQRQVVYLRTSDPAQPVVPLTFQGAALSPVHVSTDAIDLGRVVPGQQVAYEFVVTDRNNGSLELTDCKFTPDGEGVHQAAVTVNASWQATDRSADELLNDHPAVPEWMTIIRGKGNTRYRVKLAARIKLEATVGIHQGRLTLATNDPHNSTITLPMLCQVTPSQPVVPENVSFGVVRPNQVVRRTIPLGDWNAGTLKVAGSSGEFQPRVTVRQQPGQSGTVELELDLHEAPANVGAGLHQGTVTLQGSNGTLTIPWMYVAKVFMKS